MKLIQKGNAKLHNMYMFNLPATKDICGRICPGCYAIKEQVRFPIVVEARNKRLEASKQEDFVATVVKEISSLRTKPKYFRTHASGEFYSQEYIDKWSIIADKFPDITFYAYTKRLKHFDFSSLQNKENFVLINSLQFTKLNYGKKEEAPEGAFMCPSTEGATCGESCTYCMSKTAQTNGVWFIKH